MAGFFTGSEVKKHKPFATIAPLCGQCGLYRDCESPKMIAEDLGSPVVLMGDSPTGFADDVGRVFAGEPKRLVKSCFDDSEISYGQVTKTNALICHLPGKKPPNTKQIVACAPNYKATLRDRGVRLIIAMGAGATSQALQAGWGTAGLSSRWEGQQIPCQKSGMWICPTIDPAIVLQAKGTDKERFLQTRFREQVKAALDLTYREIPDNNAWLGAVVSCRDDDHAIVSILSFIRSGRPCAFDYETNMLKPDSQEAKIVSASISDGVTTVAFLWSDAVAVAFRRFLRSSIFKIAANCKFEDRWSHRILRTNIKNWYWDTMVNGHIADHRQGVTSLTFQAYTKFGIEPYEHHIKPFLVAATPNTLNNIDKIGTDDLLLYNGLDSLIEFKLAELQHKHFGLGALSS